MEGSETGLRYVDVSKTKILPRASAASKCLSGQALAVHWNTAGADTTTERPWGWKITEQKFTQLKLSSMSQNYWKKAWMKGKTSHSVSWILENHLTGEDTYRLSARMFTLLTVPSKLLWNSFEIQTHRKKRILWKEI